MRPAFRLGVGVIVLLLSSILRGDRSAAAAPSEACRTLAARFAAMPEQMDLRALAALGTCLTTEIGKRVAPPASPDEAQPGNPAPPPAQEEPPAPPPDGPPLPRARPYGTWPPPAPWAESWPSPNPW